MIRHSRITKYFFNHDRSLSSVACRTSAIQNIEGIPSSTDCMPHRGGDHKDKELQAHKSISANGPLQVVKDPRTGLFITKPYPHWPEEDMVWVALAIFDRLGVRYNRVLLTEAVSLVRRFLYQTWLSKGSSLQLLFHVLGPFCKNVRRRMV
ncbi:hypothetical protein KC356_g79 [Hortaea werneckii]|nr:hypothetical protein KC356_g79 [Hortaea werneckii]